MEKTEALYKRMFEAEESGDMQMAAIVKRYLDSVVTLTELTRSEFLSRFLEMIKPKKVYDELMLLFDSERFNELDLSIEVCSMLTHSFIAVEKISLQAYDFLRIEEQINLLNEVLRGEAGVEDVRAFYKDTLF